MTPRSYLQYLNTNLSLGQNKIYVYLLDICWIQGAVTSYFLRSCHIISIICKVSPAYVVFLFIL